MINEFNIECPCCNNQLKVEIKDDGKITVVFLGEEISSEELFLKHGICIGTKGGEKDE